MRMKRAVVTSLAVAALAVAAHAPALAQSELDEILKRKPALRTFTPQQPKRVQLPNGMLILLQEDHELPLVRGYALIRAGSRDEPAAKAGLVEVFGQAWRTGGTKARPGDALDDYLEARAAKVETWGGFDSTGISWNSLKESFEDTFASVVELLRQEPAFPQEKIDLA
jgi:zinc protease